MGQTNTTTATVTRRKSSGTLASRELLPIPGPTVPDGTPITTTRWDQVKMGQLYQLAESPSVVMGGLRAVGPVLVVVPAVPVGAPAAYIQVLDMGTGKMLGGYYNTAPGLRGALAPDADTPRMLRTVQSHAPTAWARPLRACNTGSDPEMFVLDRVTGDVIPAFAFLKPSDEVKDNHLPYYDGFQAEFRTAPWICNVIGIGTNITTGLRALYNMARKYNPNAILSAQSMVDVTPDALASLPDHLVTLGCSPSLNVYDNPGVIPENPRDMHYRMAGFHLHYGLRNGWGGHEVGNEPTPPPPDMFPDIVKMMDRLGGVTSVAAMAGLEDNRRRRHYGRAGEYRLPAHGLEYRVLSSAVLWHPAVAHLHMDLVRYAIRMVHKGMSKLWVGSDGHVQDCINNLDVKLAHRLLDKNRVLLQGVCQGIYSMQMADASNVNYVELFKQGLANYITLDMDRNWNLSNLGSYPPNGTFSSLVTNTRGIPKLK